jgi:hypothetical protein
MMLCGTIFDGEASPQIQQDLLRLLFGQYKSAFEFCKEHHPSGHGRDFLGMMRRANIETQLVSMKERHPIMSVEVTPNYTGSAHHSLITFNKVMMVQSSLKNPKHMVPPSQFRKAYAAQSLEVNPQLKLFPRVHENVIDISKPLFAMLVHGPDSTDKSRPAFAYIVFPDNTYTMYVHVINLFERFSELVKELTTTQTPEEHGELPISIQPGKKRRSKGKRNTP